MKKYLKKYKEKLEEMSPDIIISETDPLAEWFSHSLLKSYPYRIPTIFLTVFAVRMVIFRFYLHLLSLIVLSLCFRIAHLTCMITLKPCYAKFFDRLCKNPPVGGRFAL